MSSMDAARYYADLTLQYRHYGGDAHGWHYGIWEPGVTTHHASLMRSNEVLIREVPLGASSRVLDVGCGDGGFATWIARTTGASVTGITVCSEHLELARDLAMRHGVAHLCEFRLMNMDHLDLPPGTFDLVTNQETACYAADKGRYLRAVAAVLRPGGVWRALDFSVQDAPLPPADRRRYTEICEGFHMPSMVSLAEMQALMRAARLEIDQAADLTALVLPTAARIRRQCYLPRLARALHLDWTLYSFDDARRRNRAGHILAALQYSRGLERGICRYTYYSARTPSRTGGAS